MNNRVKRKPLKPVPSVEHIEELQVGDLNNLCDATDLAVKSGGGFGWVNIPDRNTLERYWQGVMAVPARILFVARLDGVICGTCQLLKPPANNEAQQHTIKLTTTFVAPWARGHGLARMLVQKSEDIARKEGFSLINLDVRATMKEAISLYESLSYQRYATHPFYAQINGEYIPGYYYYKMIGSDNIQSTA